MTSIDELEHLDRPIRVIGRYALYGRLAAGGMATVHFGRLLGPAGFSRTVAIKRLHPQFAKDPEFVAMFLDEARLAARIQHPNVVATVDVVAMSEELFLVMDYVRGESFSRLLRASRRRGIEVTAPVISSVIVGMLHGLHAAHEAKDEQGRPLAVVHRDVSPQNVLVGVDGVARVLDFGVAKASARVQITRDGQMKGKLAYMAPEQLQGKGVDRRTDVFAAGIVFWEAITGRRLFDAEEPADVLQMITTDDIPPPSAVVPSVTKAVDDLVMKALARDVTVRFQTAREFAIAVEEALPVASSREVGEWVERVAGETLLHRERAVAEIEAISSVTDVSSLESSSPRFPPSSRGVGPEQADASVWDEGPTNVLDPSRLVLSPGDDSARTRVHVPRPAAPPPISSRRIPSVTVPPSSRAPKSGTPEHLLQPPRRQMPTLRPPDGMSVPPPASKPVPPLGTLKGLAPPKPASSRPPPLAVHTAVTISSPPQGPRSPSQVFDDENEQTSVYDKSSPDALKPVAAMSKPPADASGAKSSSKPDAAASAPSAPSGLALPQVFDDEQETTSIYDPSAANKLRRKPSTPPSQYSIPTRPRNTRPPLRTPSEGPGVRTAPPTVIVQEETPAALEHTTAKRRPSMWSGAESSAVRKVAFAATVAGLLAGVLLVITTRPHQEREPQALASPPAAVPAAQAASKPVEAPAPEPAAAEGALPAVAPPPEQAANTPEKPDKPDKKKPARSASKPRARATEPATTQEVEETEAPTAAAPVSAPEPEPSTPPAPAPDDEILDNPYLRRMPAEPPAAAEPPKAPQAADPPPKAAAPKGPRDCKKPYFLDADGVRRVKPECL